MKYVATRFHDRVMTIGANTVIIKDKANINNVRYLVVVFKRWDIAELKANCGNYADALAFAHSC